MFFQHDFGNVFFLCLYQKCNVWAPTWAPTWRQKPTICCHFRIKNPKNQMGTPKARQSLTWTHPGPSENIEDALLDVENLHFSAQRPFKTERNTKNNACGQPPRLRKKLRPNLMILNTFGTILGKNTF